MEQSPEEIINQVKHRPGRFHLPLKWRLKVELELRRAGLFNLKDPLRTLVTDTGLPIQWQLLLRYLYERGLILSPRLMRLISPAEDLNGINSFYLTHASLQSDGHTPPYFCRGSSLDIEEAVAKTIGEFLERYPLLIYRNRSLVRASPSQLKRRGYDFLDPAIVSGFSEEQKRSKPEFIFDDRSQFQWIRGYSLFDQKPCFLPAQLVFWNYCLQVGDITESLIRERNTNGAAGMFTRDEAILTGLCELIQRDGLLIHWLNTLSPPRIDISDITYGRIPQLLKLCREQRLEVIVLDMTSDVAVPVCFAIIIDHAGSGPCIVLGGGCDVSAEKAVEKAIEEALGIRLWVKKLLAEGKDDNKQSRQLPSPVNSDFTNNLGGQQTRVLFWADKENFPLFRFFLAGPTEKFKIFKNRFPSLAHPQETSIYILELLRGRGREYNVYFYEAQHPILREIGYHSIRAVVPALVPFYLNEQNKPLGAKRLKEVPPKLGYNATRTTWNELMHPFA